MERQEYVPLDLTENLDAVRMAGLDTRVRRHVIALYIVTGYWDTALATASLVGWGTTVSKVYGIS